MKLHIIDSLHNPDHHGPIQDQGEMLPLRTDLVMLGEHAFMVEQVFLLMEAVWLMHGHRERGGKGADNF